MVGILAASGCDAKRREVRQAPSSKVVATSMDVIGGLARWKDVGRVHATAVVTIYDDAGKGTVNEQRQVIDIHRNVIHASAMMPQGQWNATVPATGKAPLKTSGSALTKAERDRLIRSLRIILHRVQGPLNLSMHNEKPGKPASVVIGGKKFIRLAVTGGNSDIKAYYFDPQTYVLEMVTAGADKPGGKGTVTLYSWKLLPNGLAFPERISVMKIGSEVLIGNTPVLEVNYLNVQTEKKQNK